MTARSKQDGGLWPDWIQPVWVTIRGLHYTRIENECSEGFPDVELCYHSFAAWLELKVAKRPKREGGPIQTNGKDWVRPGQVVWLRKRWRAGGSAWILLRLSGRGPAAFYLVPGYDALWLRERPSEPEIQQRAGVVQIYSPGGILAPLVAGPGAL